MKQKVNYFTTVLYKYSTYFLENCVHTYTSVVVRLNVYVVTRVYTYCIKKKNIIVLRFLKMREGTFLPARFKATQCFYNSQAGSESSEDIEGVIENYRSSRLMIDSFEEEVSIKSIF